jgi:hypothetical protein
LKRAGKKTKEWAAARKILKPKFQAAGITTCELGYRNCWYDNALSFAHARKRNDLRPGELYEVILCCTPCHDILERMPKPIMYAAVHKIIAARKDFQKKLLT